MTASKQSCPRVELHTGGQPTGYLSWHQWAARMSKTHRQRKCPGCGLFEIWEPVRFGSPS